MTDIRVLSYEDGGSTVHFLHIGPADGPAAELFEERGLEGGGYTWEPLVRALVELYLPDCLALLEFDAEAGNCTVSAEDPAVLGRVAGLVRDAEKDRARLLAALQHAGDEVE